MSGHGAGRTLQPGERSSSEKRGLPVNKDRLSLVAAQCVKTSEFIARGVFPLRVEGFTASPPGLCGHTNLSFTERLCRRISFLGARISSS